jgi:iron complex outermembrane receptor protein
VTVPTAAADLRKSRRETLDSTNGAKIGEPLPNKPKDSFSGFARYRIRAGRLSGLSLGTGVRWAGDRPGASGTTLINPGYTVVNAQASYAWRQSTFNVVVNNVFDERYRTNTAALNSNRFGPPLSYRASLRLRF